MGSKKSSIGCLFWVALVLLVLVIFLFNRKTIETVLEKTGLMNYIAREKPVEDTDGQPEAPEITRPEVTRVEEDNRDETRDTDSAEEPENPEPKIVVTEQEPDESPEDTAPEPRPEERVRRATLYFVHVNENGGITLYPVVRPVSFIDSPLTETLNSLLKGLTSSEINEGLLSLVPKDTRVESVVVRGDTAYINFNEPFRFNTFGREGYLYQLRQVVYTATEFGTVRNVQILIDGERVSYLGPESPYIGEPISRESL